MQWKPRQAGVNRSEVSSQRKDLLASAAVLGALILAYVALCLVVLHRPDWLSWQSALHASFVGPPALLAWGYGLHSLFWGVTISLVVVAALGSIFRRLVLSAAGLCFVIWVGAGFFAVALSV